MRGALLLALFAAVSPAAAGVAVSTAPAVAVSTVSAPFAWRTVENKVFAPGESLRFAIKYGFITGGHATLELRSTETVAGRPAFHVVSEARTNGTVDVFFKVRDLNESWMDVQSLCSLRYRQVMREGGYSRDILSDFDHPAGRFHCWRKNKKGKESTEDGVIPAYVHDVLSSLYYIRTRPMKEGEEFLLDANSSAQTWSLKVKVKRKEKIKVPAGTFTCWRVEPLISGDGLFMQTGNLEVWMTDDERRMPVLMRSKVTVGSFTAELEGYTLPELPR